MHYPGGAGPARVPAADISQSSEHIRAAGVHERRADALRRDVGGDTLARIAGRIPEMGAVDRAYDRHRRDNSGQGDRFHQHVLARSERDVISCRAW